MQQPLALITKEPPFPNIVTSIKDCCHFYSFIFFFKCENNEKLSVLISMTKLSIPIFGGRVFVHQFA